MNRGRPKKEPANRHDYYVSLHLDFRAYFTLKAAVTQSGMNRSEYLRQLIRKGKVTARFSAEELSLYRSISGMANNLNQLTKRSILYGVSNIEKELRELSLQVRVLLTQFEQKQ